MDEVALKRQIETLRQDVRRLKLERDLLEATGAESPLQVGEELDLETESGLLLIIKITALDEGTDKASFEIVSQHSREPH